MSKDDSRFGNASSIGGGYATFQLSKALNALDATTTEAEHANALGRIARWRQVIAQQLQGSVAFGSRVPLTDVPAWVTLEVVTGGFVTGQLLAGGELTAHERLLAASTPGVRSGTERLDINAWHLTDDGIALLQKRLATQDYCIEVPEEAALLTVAWLLGQQRAAQARSLIESIAPFFDRLRFFPAPAHKEPESLGHVQLFDAGEVKQRLQTLKPHPRLVELKRVVEIRLPLYDAAIAHFLTTYQDQWPCQFYPAGWREQAMALCARFETDCGVDLRTRQYAKDRVLELYVLLEQCALQPASLSGRQVGRIRRIVGDFVSKHGPPDSTTHRETRDKQRSQVAGPFHSLIAKAVAARMEHYPAHAGIADVTPLSVPITAQEASTFKLVEDATLPASILRRVALCRRGTIEQLIEYGLISSADTIARVLPAMTAQIRSAGFQDPTLRNLYAATYRAFRRRRSLLLLNLQSQVGMDELPWVAAVERDRESDTAMRASARQTLVDVAALSVCAFPQAILPNKLLQEFRALAQDAGMSLPFVGEIAADIFTGEFSSTFSDAARCSAKVIANTLYARYYAIDTDSLAVLGLKPQATWYHLPFSAKGPSGLATLSAQRAGTQPGNSYHPASNGTIIEQQQILTTQNLALLFGALDLKACLHSHLGQLAQACFTWICRRQQMSFRFHHGRLVMLKNTAYAWRQMVFYLSILDESESIGVFEAIETHFAAQPAVFRQRFLPVMIGLRMAAAGHRLPQVGQTPEGGRVFVGWTTGSHWLM